MYNKDKKLMLDVFAVIKVVHGDITKAKADIIVNAANEDLIHGGGVALAIARAGGPIIDKESREWVKKHGILKTGQVAVTSAGNLNAKWVLHVPGPRGTKPELLEFAVTNVLNKAKELGAESIAMPAISCGVFGFDKKLGAKIIYDVCKQYDGMAIYLVSTDKDIIREWEKIEQG